MKKYLLIATIHASLLFAQDNSEVKVPLSKYLELIEKQKTPPVTVVEEVILKGNYSSSAYQVVISGRAVSPWQKERVIGAFEGSLRGCNGSAILSFENGAYHVLPQKSEYSTTCKLNPKNKNLSLNIFNALFFESQVLNAEANVSNDNTENRHVALFEKARETEKRVRADVMARANYKLTILPDNSKFDYYFTINNPNRGVEKYSITWPNGEVIETVATTLKYQEIENSISLTLPPGEHGVSVRGKIIGQNFKPLLKSEEQYLLIQNHPLMQVQPTTAWRRIATSESAMSQEFSSARAFLIDPKENFEWSAKKLQVFSALGYTLKNVNYLYYVPRDGKAVVEASYQISNQGTPEISLDIPGKALFMSVDGVVSPLYKDEKGKLLVSLNSGEHTLVVQYQPETQERSLAAIVNNDLLKPAAVVSNSNLNLRYDPAWKMLVGKFGNDLSTNLHFSDILWAFFYGALFFLLLGKLYQIKDRRLLTSVSILLGLLTFFGSLYNFLLFMSAVSLAVWRYRAKILAAFRKILSTETSYKRLAVNLIVFVAFMYVLSIFVGTTARFVSNNTFSTLDNTSRNLSKDMGQMAENYTATSSDISTENLLDAKEENFKSQDEAYASGGAMPLGSRKNKSALKRPREFAAQSANESYEGLPAKIEIPQSGINQYFNISLIGAEKNMNMSTLLVKNYFFSLLDLLLLFSLGIVFYRNRKLFKDTFSKTFT